jgi:competence protein ComEA
VYSFSPGARVSDAIDRAGGGIQDADLSPLNLAARLMDGQRVQVPRIGEGAPSSNVGRVNLNRASRSELEALPGIGAATAQRIIEQRERNGPFQSLEQLRDLRLIPGSTLDRLRDLVVLN